MKASLTATWFVLAALGPVVAGDSKISEWDQPCYPIAEMPKTEVLVTPADATAYWLQTVPHRFAGMPERRLGS